STPSSLFRIGKLHRKVRARQLRHGRKRMADMRYRVLGRSGIKVSELCLGTMNFGGPTDEPEAQRIIGDALEHGVNFIDTADVYTDGRSEEIIGRALEGRRHQVVLATK